MRLLYVYDALALWGGLERIFVDKMNYFVGEYGYEVYLLTTNQGAHPIPFALDERVHYEDLRIQTHLQYRYRGLRRYWERFRRHRLLVKRLREKIGEIAPDVIIGTTSRFMPELVRLKGSTPLVSESHSGYDHVVEYDQMTWRRRWEANRLRQTLRQTDVLVALTERDAVKWRQMHHRVVQISNAVHLNDTGQYSTHQNKRIIFAGRFCNQKSIPDLLRAWRIVYERHPDWQLDLYGEGEHKERIMKEIQQMAAPVGVHPPSPDIIRHFIDSSVFVLPSLYEAFGMVIAEAMSCGVPVVAFETDGSCQLVADGKDGFIVKDRSTAGMADCICRLIEDEKLRREMGRRGIESSQRYRAENIMPMWKNLFEQLVK